MNASHGRPIPQSHPPQQTTLFPIGGLPTQVIWRPNNATAWLWATLYSPGGDGFDSSFDVTLENGVPVSGSFSGVFPLFDHSL